MADPSQASQDPLANEKDLEQDPDVGMVGVEESQPGPSQQQAGQEPDLTMPMPPPSRKDATLREFLSKMDDYAPIVSISPSPPEFPLCAIVAPAVVRDSLEPARNIRSLFITAADRS